MLQCDKFNSSASRLPDFAHAISRNSIERAGVWLQSMKMMNKMGPLLPFLSFNFNAAPYKQKEKHATWFVVETRRARNMRQTLGQTAIQIMCRPATTVHFYTIESCRVTPQLRSQHGHILTVVALLPAPVVRVRAAAASARVKHKMLVEQDSIESQRLQCEKCLCDVARERHPRPQDARGQRLLEEGKQAAGKIQRQARRRKPRSALALPVEEHLRDVLEKRAHNLNPAACV